MFSTPITFLKFVAGGPPGPDPDATAFLDAAGITDPTISSAINTLVVDLKAASLWSKFDIIYPFVGDSYNNMKLNLMNPVDSDGAFRLTPEQDGSNYFQYSPFGLLKTGGGIGSGTPYMRTYYNPDTDAVNFTATSAHVSIFDSRDQSAAPVGDGYNNGNFGTYLSAANRTILMTKYYTGYQFASINGPSTYQNVDATYNAQGFFILNRTSSANAKLWQDGAVQYDITTAGESTMDTAELLLNAINNSPTGTPSAWGGIDKTYNTFMSVGSGLTDPQVATFNTIVHDFNAALTRNPGQYDEDALNFLIATGITDITESYAINSLVVDLKAASLWDKFYAIYPMVGGTATTTKYNLVNPVDSDAAFRITWNGGWTFGASGAQGNATNTYGNTHFVMGSDLASMQSVSTGVYMSDGYISNAWYNTGLSQRSAFTESWGVYPNIGFGISIGVFDPYGESYRVGPFTAVDILGLGWADKASATSNKIYLNSTLLGSNTSDTSSAITVTEPLYLGARNDTQYNGSPSVANYSGSTMSFAFIADPIGDANVSAFYTIVQDFQTALGREV